MEIRVIGLPEEIKILEERLLEEYDNVNHTQTHPHTPVLLTTHASPTGYRGSGRGNRGSGRGRS